MFKEKPKSKDYRRYIKAKWYYPNIIIIFNKKVYINTFNLIS
jgi:mannose-1-phosphate guanylyltransferase